MPSPLNSLIQLANCRGDSRAFSFYSQKTESWHDLTYGDLLDLAERLAASLHIYGVEREPVLILLPPGPEYIVSLFGCFCAGAIAVPMFSSSSKRSINEVANVVANSGARLAIVEDARRARFQVQRKEDRHAIIKAVAYSELIQSEGINPPIFQAQDEVRYIQYSSCVTSEPKGVMVSDCPSSYKMEHMAA